MIVAEQGDRSVQARLHFAFGDAELGRNLRDGEVDLVSKDDDFA